MALSTDLTYTWEVSSLKKRNEVNVEGVTLEGAVVQTFWKLTGTDGNGNEAFFSGATPFSAVNVPAGSFTAFETLTESTVIGWIQAVVDADQGYADHICEQIKKDIDAVNTTDAAMPWAPVEESETPEPPAP
tara:strand:- start:417 stop:812 length:396 start_codon:yes stop_codon:yes gene_type:complete